MPDTWGDPPTTPPWPRRCAWDNGRAAPRLRGPCRLRRAHARRLAVAACVPCPAHGTATMPMAGLPMAPRGPQRCRPAFTPDRSWRQKTQVCHANDMALAGATNPQCLRLPGRGSLERARRADDVACARLGREPPLVPALRPCGACAQLGPHARAMRHLACAVGLPVPSLPPGPVAARRHGRAFGHRRPARAAPGQKTLWKARMPGAKRQPAPIALVHGRIPPPPGPAPPSRGSRA